jgi:two-component system, OmpR family, osmolarity sensor histidine kinase EnvZ
VIVYLNFEYHLKSHPTESTTQVRLTQNSLIRILNNLLQNALRYGLSSSGELHLNINISEHTDTLSMVIEDHGSGVSEDNLAKLTEPFFRADESRNLNDQAGSGLGLAIINDLMQHASGTIGLSNRPNGGLRVSLEFQLIKPTS